MPESTKNIKPERQDTISENMQDEITQFKRWLVENLPETRGLQIASILSLLSEHAHDCNTLNELEKRLNQASRNPSHLEEEPFLYLQFKIREFQREHWVIK